VLCYIAYIPQSFVKDHRAYCNIEIIPTSLLLYLMQMNFSKRVVLLFNMINNCVDNIKSHNYIKIFNQTCN